jgi:hypothetical protein
MFVLEALQHQSGVCGTRSFATAAAVEDEAKEVNSLTLQTEDCVCAAVLHGSAQSEYLMCVCVGYVAEALQLQHLPVRSTCLNSRRAQTEDQLDLKQTVAGQSAVATDDERKWVRKESRFYC